MAKADIKTTANNYNGHKSNNESKNDTAILFFITMTKHAVMTEANINYTGKQRMG